MALNFQDCVACVGDPLYPNNPCPPGQLPCVPCDTTVQSCNLLCNTNFECPRLIGQDITIPISSSCPGQSSVPCWCSHGSITFTNHASSGNYPGPHAGTQYIQLTNATPVVWQNFTIPNPGTTVSISFWYAGAPSGFIDSLLMKITNTTGTITYVSYGPITGTIGVWNQITITYTFAASGIYQLSFNALGAFNSGFIDDVTIMYSPLPTVTATFTAPLFAGQPIYLQAVSTTAVSYAWTGPNTWNSVFQNPIGPIAVAGVTDGIYTVEVTDINGCKVLASVNVIISANTYIIHDCANPGQTDFITNDLGIVPYVGQTIKTCIGATPRAKSIVSTDCVIFSSCCGSFQFAVHYSEIPIPLPSGATWSFVLYPGMCFTISAININCPSSLFVIIDWADITAWTIHHNTTCIDCLLLPGNVPCTLPLSQYYLFTNCCDATETYQVGSVPLLPLGFAVGQVVTVDLEPILLGKCWLVELIIDNPIINPIILEVFNAVTTYPDCKLSPCNNCNPIWPDGCYCVEITECLPPTPPVSGVCLSMGPWAGTIWGAYANCEDCQRICYILTDCTNLLNVQVVSNDFSQYIGQYIKLVDCDTCWFIELSLTCDNSCLVQLDSVYDTCEDCLPAVLPIPPEPLKVRSVKPGYDTPGCSPEYTEKISCNFAGAVYAQMIRIRYGLTTCCEEDLNSTWVKKQELDLRAIFEVNACITIIP